MQAGQALKQYVLYALCAAIAVISKEMLAFLPNIELVSFLFILYGIHFRWQGAVFTAILFSFLQMLLYGVGMWTPMYFIVWSGVTLLAHHLRNRISTESRCALFSGIFGLVFGFLFALPYFVISIRLGWIYFIKGIPFDLIHALGNYIIMSLLFDRINVLFIQLKQRYPM